MKASKAKIEEQDFARFLKERDKVGRAYVRGDFAPLQRIIAQTGPGVFFGPGGGAVKSAAKVAARYERDAKRFEPVGTSKLEILHQHASDGLAYWVGFQRATARLQGMKKAVPMDLRVTEVFVRGGGGWKLIHRHADPLVEPTKK